MRDVLSVEDFSRLNYYADGVSFNAGTFALDGKIHLIAMVTSMRIRKEAVSGNHSYSCYDFNNYHDVPLPWQQTRNTIFNAGQGARLNDDEFRGPAQMRATHRTGWIFRSILQKNRNTGIHIRPRDHSLAIFRSNF